MRFSHAITALLVLAALYLFIFERPWLRLLAQSPDPVAAEAPADTTAQRVPVVALNARAQPLERIVTLRGVTEAARRVEVRAETTSTVISEPLRRGARVDQGDLLCQLDPGIRDAALAEAEAALASAQTELAQAEQLALDGFASQNRLIIARAGHERALAGVKAAQTELARLNIRAPFAGILETDSAEIGSFLAAGTLCATVFQLDPIKLVGFISEGDIDRITPGAAAQGRLMSGREVAGRVSFVSRTADPMTRTFQVDIELPNPDLAIRDGQSAQIAIATGVEPAHLLPQSALTLDDAGIIGVRLVDGDMRARFAPVSVLRDAPGGIWVAGLPDVAQVIVVGQEYVRDGVEILPDLRESYP